MADKRLGMLKIGDEAGTRVLVLRLAAHANVLTADNYLISSDYYGAAREMLEARFGCRVMITQGAAGDVRAKYRQENADFLEEHPDEAAQIELSTQQKEEIFEQSMEALRRNAWEITQAVDKVFGGLTMQPISRVAVRSEIQVFYADVPSETRAMAIAEEAAQKAGIDGAAWFEEVKHLISQGVTTQQSTREVQYFCINEGCFCGIPDEPMSEIACMAADWAGNPYLFLGGYTNGTTGYLPSAQAYDEGGYEVLWSNLWLFQISGRVVPFNRDSAERLAQSIKAMWERITGA